MLQLHVLMVHKSCELSLHVSNHMLYPVIIKFTCINYISCYISVGKWNDDNCNDQLGFVCKKKNGTYIPKTIPPSQPVPGYCPKGFVGAGKN